MKILNTVKDLITICSKCAICGAPTEVLITTAPDYNYTFTGMKLSDRTLEISTRIEIPNYDSVQIDIDLYTNKFRIGNIHIDNQIKIFLHEYDKNYEKFYWYVQTDCEKCEWYAISTDIEMDFENNIVYNIGIERTGFDLNINNKIYNIIVDYEKNDIIISLGRKSYIVPIWEVDLSDIEKLKNRIKTVLVFG